MKLDGGEVSWFEKLIDLNHPNLPPVEFQQIVKKSLKKLQVSFSHSWIFDRYQLFLWVLSQIKSIIFIISCATKFDCN